jgi:hypothetical protein
MDIVARAKNWLDWLFQQENPPKTITVLPLKIAVAKALKANAKVGLASIT